MVTFSLSMSYELLKKVQEEVKKLRSEAIEKMIAEGKSKKEAEKIAEKEHSVSSFVRTVVGDYFHDVEVDINDKE